MAEAKMNMTTERKWRMANERTLQVMGNAMDPCVKGFQNNERSTAKSRVWQFQA